MNESINQVSWSSVRVTGTGTGTATATGGFSYEYMYACELKENEKARKPINHIEKDEVKSREFVSFATKSFMNNVASDHNGIT